MKKVRNIKHIRMYYIIQTTVLIPAVSLPSENSTLSRAHAISTGDTGKLIMNFHKKTKNTLGVVKLSVRLKCYTMGNTSLSYFLLPMKFRKPNASWFSLIAH